MFVILNVLKCMKQTIVESLATHSGRCIPLLWLKYLYVYHNPAKTRAKVDPLGQPVTMSRAVCFLLDDDDTL